MAEEKGLIDVLESQVRHEGIVCGYAQGLKEALEAVACAMAQGMSGDAAVKHVEARRNEMWTRVARDVSTIGGQLSPTGIVWRLITESRSQVPGQSARSAWSSEFQETYGPFPSKGAALSHAATLPREKLIQGCRSRGDSAYCDDLNCECNDRHISYRYRVVPEEA